MLEIRLLIPNFTPLLILMLGTNSTLLPSTPFLWDSIYSDFINDIKKNGRKKDNFAMYFKTI